MDGRFFAFMTAGAGENVFTSLTQTVSLRAGDVITGWSFFCDSETDRCGGEGGEPGFCDLAVARVMVAAGQPQTVFSADACSGNSTNWTQWSFVVPGKTCSLVDVTIFAGVANEGDNSVPGKMGLDNVKVNDSACAPTATPQHVSGIGGAAAVVAVAGAGEKNRERVATESAAAQGQPEAPVVSAPQTGTGRITAPNTGEAGLASTAAPPTLPALAVALGFGAIAGCGLMYRARKR